MPLNNNPKNKPRTQRRKMNPRSPRKLRNKANQVESNESLSIVIFKVVQTTTVTLEIMNNYANTST
jgi:hypothetical protein